MRIETPDTDAAELSVDADVRKLINAVAAEHDCAASPPTTPAEYDDPDKPLWNRLEDLGLARLAAPEERGGSEAGWAASAELVKAFARRGCSLPLGESDLVADWVLSQAGLPAAPGLHGWWKDDGRPSPRALHPLVDPVVVVRTDDGEAAITRVPSFAIQERIMAGRWPDGVEWTPVPQAVVRGAELRSALIKGLQIIGAMESAVNLAIVHVTEREQFGRPIAKFQAVQQLVSTMAAEAALAAAAVDSAVMEMALHGGEWDRVLPSIAVARSCAGHAAAVVARNAHQVLGAIGTTKEHRLHRYTTAMLAWRSEAGDTRTWDRHVLELALDRRRINDLDFNTHQIEIHPSPGGLS